MKINPLGLLPPVTFPVPAGTPMISPLIQWDHSQSWDVPDGAEFIGSGANGQSGCGFDIDVHKHSEDAYLTGHQIDERVLFPATGYLTLAWRTLAKREGIQWEEMAVTFEDVDIQRATIIPPDGMYPSIIQFFECQYQITVTGKIPAF